MMGKSIVAWLLAAVPAFVAVPAKAQSPDAILAMCKRDANNTVRRLKSDVSSGMSSLQSLESNCIQGPKAEQIKGLAGYAEVQKLYQEAKSLAEAAVSKAASEGAAATSSALAAGPGGDIQAIRARWKAQPVRCQDSKEWDKAAGLSTGGGGGRTARIAGLEDETTARKSHDRVFQGRGGSGRYPTDFTPDDHLARIVCGRSAEGIDPFFSANRDLVGTQFLEGDPRVALAGALQATGGDPDRRVLYRAALMHECFQATGWDVKEDYEAYLYCSDAVGEPPAEADVNRAVAGVFPNRDFERDNLVFIARRAAKAMQEVTAAFQKMEAKYPRMQVVYRDSALQARQRWEARRRKYAEAYRVLDPISARLLDDPDSAPPADCEKSLLGLRSKLAAEIKPKDGEGIRQLRVEHPLGYQISEALAYCHLGHGRLAKAKLEADALQKPNRRVGLGEELFYARLDALRALEGELKTEDKIKAVVPNYRPYGTGMPLPGTVHRRPRFFAMIDDRGRFETLGQEEKKPAVVAALKSNASGGADLVFEKYTFLHKYRDSKCKETDRLDHYEFRSDASGRTIMKPIYRIHCWSVGPEKTEKITYQEKPVSLPAADAKLVEKGRQVTVLANTKAKPDTALVDCWDPKAGRDKAVVIQGIPVR